MRATEMKQSSYEKNSVHKLKKATIYYTYIYKVQI